MVKKHYIIIKTSTKVLLEFYKREEKYFEKEWFWLFIFAKHGYIV
jgi:hypothetical protein